MSSTAHRPTIHDVAARAGVSKSLVSLVLRGAPNVSDRRRQAVEQAVAELNYRPNDVARSLVRRSSRTMGVLVLDLHNPVFVEILDGIDQDCNAHGFTLLMASGGTDPGRELHSVEMLMDRQVDGLLLVGHRLAATDVRRLARDRPLVVITRRDVRGPGVDTVCNDDMAGAGLAVTHLVGLGHTDIVHLAGGESAAAQDRRGGYERAMRQHGLGRSARVVRSGLTDDAGYEATRGLMASQAPPSALFVANDFAALGAIAAIEEIGMRVPEDVSVAGYDGMAVSGMRRIDLTTVGQPLALMGEIAAELLRRRIGDRGVRARNIVLQPRLIARSSTAAAPIRQGRRRGELCRRHSTVCFSTGGPEPGHQG